MPASDSLLRLVDQFDRQLPTLKRKEYGETEVRVEYIDQLMIALGWDVHNTQGYANAYKEVVHEDAVRIGGVLKAPDYGFRIGGVRKFFLEAKKPSVEIKSEVAPAFQLRRYAWSAKLPLSILTDFEEFAVYDCRIEPRKNDAASVARTLYLRYTDYAERWQEIAAVFARESILKGSFDAYVDSSKAKRGTTEVDQAFLATISRWREELARNLALRNPGLSARELNFAVQQTIDRIIFLRICEDRGLEAYDTLGALTNGPRIYPRLVQEFQRADAKYNSGLFHFRPEREQAGDPDTLTPNLVIDDKPLREILRALYYPDSPYEFSVLPADILGQVYEQFLGQVIRLTSGHQAKIEEKPEVKKAGGVYYTPTYIVDYIVRQTVGALVADKRPGPRGGVSKLRIVDPACGSGSFLIGAYQFLLDWHLAHYVADDPAQWATKRNPQLYRTSKGDWRLTIDERKRILINNIFGVDIDPQAVEVTKLSLLLKVLEGESEATLNPQLALFPDRVLPDLAKNIRCGNSLIGPEFYAGRQMGLLAEEELLRVNAFEWRAAFPEVFAEGGFDAVIGNPPYIRIQAMKEWAPVEVEFYKKQYRAASKGNYDIYVVFVEKGLSLLREGGLLGFILPHKFFNAQYGEPLRDLIEEGQHLHAVVHFNDQQVFQKATTYTCLMFLGRESRPSFEFDSVKDLGQWRINHEGAKFTIHSEAYNGKEWNFGAGHKQALIDRLANMPTHLGSLSDRIAQGIRTSANEVFVLDLVSSDGRMVRAMSEQLGKEVELESELVLNFLRGREIKAFRISDSGKLVIVPYRVSEGRSNLIAESELKRLYPLTYQYLVANKRVLEQREKGRMVGEKWYGYIYPKNLEIMKGQKLLVPDIADRSAFAFDEYGQFTFTSGYALTLKRAERPEYLYTLGLLNSRLLSMYLRHISTPMRGGFFRYFTQFMELLPIRTIDNTVKADVARHDTMVDLVQVMLDLHAKLAAATLPQMKELYRSQIAATDRRIDALVYELYALSDAEIALVEA